jgi:TRAP-type C4-dicarboxylate transport system substrate-binding protein
MKEWGSEIEKKTDGRVKFQYYPGGTLLKGNEIYDGVIKGVSDMGDVVLAYNRGRFPAMEALDLPLGYPNATVATLAVNNFYDRFKPKELDDVKILFFHAHGPGILHSKRPVKTIEDMAGLKVRSTGFIAKLTEELGGLPVAMTIPNSYEALQKGVVEATFNPIEALQSYKQAEVVKYTTLCYSIGYTTAFANFINRNTWKSLSEDIQNIFEETSNEYSLKMANKVWEVIENKGKEFSLRLGHEFIPLSPEENERWEKAAQVVIDEYIEDAKEKGLPGDEYISFIKDFINKENKSSSE